MASNRDVNFLMIALPEIEMNAFFFVMGFVWILTSVGTVVLGPCYGFDREKAKKEIMEFYQKMPNSLFKRIPILLLLFVALLGFFLPAIYPILGVFVACLFFLVS